MINILSYKNSQQSGMETQKKNSKNDYQIPFDVYHSQLKQSRESTKHDTPIHIHCMRMRGIKHYKCQ